MLVVFFLVFIDIFFVLIKEVIAEAILACSLFFLGVEVDNIVMNSAGISLRIFGEGVHVDFLVTVI